MSYKRPALLIFMLALAISGCGGSSQQAKQLTRQQLLAKADAICARLVAQVTPIHESDVSRAAPRIVAYERAALSDLNKLTAPSSLAYDWNQILETQQEVSNETIKLAQLTEEKNTGAARIVLTNLGKLQHEMLTIAARDGFKECSHIA
jgi:hypothetical protein